MKNLKNMSKRALALLLTLIMCLSMVNFTAFAAEDETEPVSETTPVVDVQVTEETEQVTEETEQVTEETEQTTEETEQDTEGTEQDTEETEQDTEGTEQDTEETEQDTEETEQGSEETEQPAESEKPVCTCETKCAEDAVDSDCPVCSADDADLSACAGEDKADEEEVPETVQAFLDAVAKLPETVTEENAEEVAALMADCQDAYDALDPEYLDREDVTAAVIKMASLMEEVESLALVFPTDPVAKIGDVEYPMLALAVKKAATGDTITLVKDVTESVTVDKSVTIDLDGHIWTGKDTTTLTVSGTNNVTVKNGTMTAAENCKAIEAKSGTLVLDGITFTGNTTKQGAVNLSASTAGALTAEISNCTFTQNVRAIYASKANLTLNNCGIIENNNLTWGNGAIVYLSSSVVAINGGKVAGNTGVENKVIEISGGSLVMDGTELTNNTSYGVVGTSSAADITMKNVTATGNTGTSYMNSGGSVLNANSISGKTVILENVTATGNEQTKEHGGVFYLGGSSNNTSTVIEIKNCKLTGNTAKNGGGAIYVNNKGTTTITDTEISSNTANGTGKYAAGGLQVGSTSGTVTLAGTTRIYNNQAPKASVKHQTVGATADIALVSNYSSKTDFASEDAVQRATLVLNNETRFTGTDGNQYTLTKSDAKGLRYSSGSGSSKKFYWPVGYYTVKVEPSVVYLNAPANSHAASNTVILANDLADAVAQANAKGAKTIYVCGNTTVDAANVAALNSGIAFVRCSDHPNGHMFTINGDVTLNGAHIDGNKVDGDASLIYVPSSGHLTITGETLIENGKNAASRGNGGGINVSQGGLTMTGGTIDNCSAYQGGGIYAYSSLNGNKIVFEGGKVSNNTATGGNGGGGAYIGATSSEFGVNGGRTYFENNIANQLGGGVFLVNGTNANTHHYIYKATFTGNKSYRSMQYFDGGAIYIQSGTTAHMKNVYVSGNTDSDSALAHNNYTAVAVCPTGELAVYELDGLLAINNNGKVDIGVVGGGTMPSVDPMVYLPSNAPGGGEVSYTYSNGTKVNLADHQFMKGYFRVKTSASQSAIDAARATAEADGVVITGNYATQFGAGIMTNGILKIGTETTTLRVNKVWTDGVENHENDQILVYLTKDGKIVDKDFRSDSSVVLNKDNNWSYTWTNLGDQFTWGVKEASVDGYTSEVKVEKDTEFGAIADKYYVATITNTPGKETNKLVIHKTAYGLDPDASYKFTLKLKNLDGTYAIRLPDGALTPIYNNEVTFYMKRDQVAVVDGLPGTFYKDNYELVEESSSEYSSSQYESVTANEGGAGNIYSVEVVNMPMTQVSVEKAWDRADDKAAELRPASVTVDLLANGKVEDTVTLNEGNNWRHTFKNLPKYDADENKITYTVEEHEVPGFINNVAGSVEDGFVITNSLERGSLTITKAFKGITSEADGNTFTFEVKGPYGYENTVTVSKETNWKAELPDLIPGKYTVTESKDGTEIGNYTWKVVKSEEAQVTVGEKGVTITNEYVPYGSLTITKEVKGVSEDLYKDKKFTFTVKGPKEVNGTYGEGDNAVTFTDGEATVTITGAGRLTIEKLPMGTYTVTEDKDAAAINGYNLSVSSDGEVELKNAGDSPEAKVTNTYAPPSYSPDPEYWYQLVTYYITHLADGTIRYDGVKVQQVKATRGRHNDVFQANEGKAGEYFFAASDYTEYGDYSYDFMPGYIPDASTKYLSSVHEIKLSKPNTKSNPYTLVMWYERSETDIEEDPTPTTGTLSVEKVWLGDAGANRPASVSVQILKDGTVVETVVLSDANDWSWSKILSEEELESTWTVSEINVPEGYTSSVSADGTSFTVTNSYSPTDTPKEPTPPTDVPDNPPPLVDWPIEPPVVEIPEVPVPTVPAEPEVDIPEGPTPMVDIPQTGDISLAWYAVAILSACGLIVLMLRKREGEEA